MARKWSGFLPQNQEVKEQWGLLEASREQIVDAVHFLAGNRDEFPEPPDDEPPALPQVGKPH